jgi:hypothetical protein
MCIQDSSSLLGVCFFYKVMNLLSFACREIERKVMLATGVLTVGIVFFGLGLVSVMRSFNCMKTGVQLSKWAVHKQGINTKHI